jgi:hypothetical protein
MVCDRAITVKKVNICINACSRFVWTCLVVVKVVVTDNYDFKLLSELMVVALLGMDGL